jgi:hypothetical protein
MSSFVDQIKENALKNAFMPAEDKALIRSSVQKVTADNVGSVSAMARNESTEWSDYQNALFEQLKDTNNSERQKSLKRRIAAVDKLLEELPNAVTSFVKPLA